MRNSIWKDSYCAGVSLPPFSIGIARIVSHGVPDGVWQPLYAMRGRLMFAGGQTPAAPELLRSGAAALLLDPSSREFLSALDAGENDTFPIYEVRQQLHALCLDPAANLGSSQIVFVDSTSQPSEYPGVSRPWPSLFKGNVFRFSNADGEPYVEKLCSSGEGFVAEAAWGSLHKVDQTECQYFRPVRLAGVVPAEDQGTVPALRFRRHEGISAAELLWRVQEIGRVRAELVPKLEVLSGLVLWQAAQALKEFQEIGRSWSTSAYPWPDQLRKALLETQEYLATKPGDIDACLSELDGFGRYVEEIATEPFRDAHLKNRLIALPGLPQTNDEQFCNWIRSASEGEMNECLRQATCDIDFETGLMRVSEWDDKLHILWSSNIGIDQPAELREGAGPVEAWWADSIDEPIGQSFWATLLCRSFREFCRRLWYDQVMPWTYRTRYRIERRDHFLELALAAAAHLDGADTLRRVLTTCQKRGSALWRSQETRRLHEPVVARFPARHSRSIWT